MSLVIIARWLAKPEFRLYKYKIDCY